MILICVERQAIALYPEASNVDLSVLLTEDIPQLQKQLLTLGFATTQTMNATNALSQATPLSASLLATSSPLQACIEYLVLHLPECDLPQRFIPSHNSSNPFVTSTHSGTEDLKTRWLEDKAIKECGWPPHVVKELTAKSNLTGDWARFIRSLNCRLLGENDEAIDPAERSGDLETLDADDIEGFGGHFLDGSQLTIPLPVAPIQLNVIVDADHTLAISGDPPPMYLTSTTVPAYIRLYLLSKLLVAFKDGTLIEPGETFLLASLRLLEEEWAQVEDSGPPQISHVLQYMLPRRLGQDLPGVEPAKNTDIYPRSATKKGKGTPKGDTRTGLQVKEELEAIRRSEKYAAIFSARKKLPSFSSREEFLSVLEKNKCVVVVGETGEQLTTLRHWHCLTYVL